MIALETSHTPSQAPSNPRPARPADDAALDRVRINFHWLLKLRWAAAAGQAATIALVVYGLGIALPLLPLIAILAFEALSNVVLHGWSRGRFREPGEPRTREQLERGLGVVMLFDLVLLFALLFFTGGPTNPFSMFFMVNIVLAAVLLKPRATFALTIVALFAYTALFFVHVPVRELDVMSYLTQPGTESTPFFFGRLSVYLAGLLTAFVAAVIVIVWFVTRVSSERGTLERELSARQQSAARAERLEALGTLAAGAAHELASPLSTIAVIAKDLERQLLAVGASEEVAEDARLIRSEVGRCRAILDQMAIDAGQSLGESQVATTARELLAEALDTVREPERVEVTIDDPERALGVPRRALGLALRQIIKNALDASPLDFHVVVRVDVTPDTLRVVVRDQGSGMDAQTLARATDPFFTTKEPGKGMGLGLFLTQTVVERLAGNLAFESVKDRGTTVKVTIPLLPAWSKQGWGAAPSGGERKEPT
ncbi:MAG: HAMP domain-containing histidine kinase [Planctomycetes bacterium]|nr:HAMP domain-containing histidine kinase [Planctomycetota bacterium]